MAVDRKRNESWNVGADRLDLAREWFVEKFGKLWRALAHGGGEFVSVELSGQWVLEIHAGPVSRPPRVDESCYGPVR